MGRIVRIRRSPEIRRRKPEGILAMTVQAVPCRTCPFEGEEPIELSPASRSFYISNIIGLNGQHPCHSTDNKTLCRGGRNILLRVLVGYGQIAEPTDEAFDAAQKKAFGL